LIGDGDAHHCSNEGLLVRFDAVQGRDHILLGLVYGPLLMGDGEREVWMKKGMESLERG
jgi:hypothetical protein